MPKQSPPAYHRDWRVKNPTWFAYFDNLPTATLPGFQIKETDIANCPVGVISIGHGQTKKDKGYKRQLKNARLTVCAPEMHKAIELAAIYLEDGAKHTALEILNNALKDVRYRKIS